MGLDRDWQSTQIRNRNQIQETMVETLRNEAINQIAVGGNVRDTKPAAANPASRKHYRDTKRRNLIVTLRVKIQSTREHLTVRGEKNYDFLRREATEIALTKTNFRISDQILTSIVTVVGAGVYKCVRVYALSKHWIHSCHRHCRETGPALSFNSFYY